MKEKGNNKMVRIEIAYPPNAILYKHRLAGAWVAFDPK